MATWRELLSAVGRFSSATMISRVLGLIRDVCIADFILGHAQSAFFAALTIPSTFRQLFAEGTLSSALIPILTQTRNDEGEEAAREAAWAILRAVALTVGAVSFVAIVTAPLYTPVVLAGWKARTGQLDLDLVCLLVQYMFPFLLLVSIGAWCMGVLNVHNIYFIPAVSPALFNATMILVLIAAAFLVPPEQRVYWAAAGVLVGGVLQLALNGPPIRRIGYWPRLRGPVLHPRTWQFLRTASPAILGLAVYQLNILINRLYFGSYLEDAASIASLFLAFRLVQFPQGVLGVAITAAAFPRIAASAEAGQREMTSQTVRRSLELLLVVLVPSSVGLALVGHDLAGLVFSHGEFAKAGGLRILTPALYAYCVGLTAFSSTKLATQLSYAHHDFTTPVLVGLCTLAINVSVCWLGVFRLDLGVLGIAGATSVAAWCQLIMLLSVQRRRLTGFRPGHLLLVALRVGTATVAMGLAVWCLLSWMTPGTAATARLMRVTAGVAVGCGVYTALGALLFRQDLVAAIRPRAEDTGR